MGTAEAGSVCEHGYVIMFLGDFLGIDENNLAVTLLFSKSAQFRCSCWQAEVVRSRTIAELDKAKGSSRFCSFDLWGLPNRELTPGGIKGAEFHHSRCTNSCSRQKSSRVGVFCFCFCFNLVGFSPK